MYSTQSSLWLLHGWCQVKLLPSLRKFCVTIQPCTSLQCHFIQSHIGRVYASLAVTCHLHFWQNDPDHLRATAVTRNLFLIHLQIPWYSRTPFFKTSLKNGQSAHKKRGGLWSGGYFHEWKGFRNKPKCESFTRGFHCSKVCKLLLSKQNNLITSEDLRISCLVTDEDFLPFPGRQSVLVNAHVLAGKYVLANAHVLAGK